MDENEGGIKFLESLGIQAYILPDIIFGNLVVIATKDYVLNRRQIDAWFKFVRQTGKRSHFQARTLDLETSSRDSHFPVTGFFSE